LVTYRRLAIHPATSKSQKFQINKQYQNLMNNTELIDTLDVKHLLSLVELLSRALMMPEESLRYIASEELFYNLPIDARVHCEDLNDYERLKIMQLAINTLVTEAEKPAISMLQLALPIETTLAGTLNTVLPDY
jgi:hypothetical protein